MFHVPHGGEAVLAGVAVVAVEVAGRQGAAVVADDDAVRVQHGHNLEDEFIAQFL